MRCRMSVLEMKADTAAHPVGPYRPSVARLSFTVPLFLVKKSNQPIGNYSLFLSLSGGTHKRFPSWPDVSKGKMRVRGEEFYRSYDRELSDRRGHLRFDEPGEQRGGCCHLCQSRCQRRQAAAVTGSSAEPARFDQK